MLKLICDLSDCIIFVFCAIVSSCILHCKINTGDENFWPNSSMISHVKLYSLNLCPWTFPYMHYKHTSSSTLQSPRLIEQLRIIQTVLYQIIEGISVFAWKLVPSEISGISAATGLLNTIRVNMWPYCLKKGTFLS